MRTFLYARIAASLKRTVEEVMSSDDDPIHTYAALGSVDSSMTLLTNFVPVNGTTSTLRCGKRSGTSTTLKDGRYTRSVATGPAVLGAVALKPQWLQKKGEAVFIPAYCAHQVCNLADCVKVAGASSLSCTRATLMRLTFGGVAQPTLSPCSPCRAA